MITVCKDIISRGISLRLKMYWPSYPSRPWDQLEVGLPVPLGLFFHKKTPRRLIPCTISNSLNKFSMNGNSASIPAHRSRPKWLFSNVSNRRGLPVESNVTSRGCLGLSLGVKILKTESPFQKLYVKCFSSQAEHFNSCSPNSVNPQSIYNPGETKPAYLHFHSSCQPETSKEILSSFQVIMDYVNEEEEEILMKELEPHLKRLHYEFDHWDDAIHGFRETERSRWGKAASPIISRMRKFGFPDEKDHIPQIHVLDLAKTGVIKPHVDSIRFCGNIICGLCLLSDAVMRLVHVENKDQITDVMLPRRALYIMKDESRFKYTHEVLGEKESFFSDTTVPRDRRVSVMLRNNPKEENSQ